MRGQETVSHQERFGSLPRPPTSLFFLLLCLQKEGVNFTYLRGGGNGQVELSPSTEGNLSRDNNGVPASVPPLCPNTCTEAQSPHGPQLREAGGKSGEGKGVQAFLHCTPCNVAQESRDVRKAQSLAEQASCSVRSVRMSVELSTRGNIHKTRVSEKRTEVDKQVSAFSEEGPLAHPSL